MTKYTYIFIPVFFLFLTACNDSYNLAPLSDDAIILAFGDSLTYGVGAKEGRAYPEVLSGLTGLKVINAGKSGETTSQGMLRFQKVLNEYSPELVVLLEGGNDILRNHPALVTKKNLSHMIEMAQEQGVSIVLIGVPKKSLFSYSAPFYKELAEKYELAFDGELLSDLLRSSKYKSDPIHLNPEGYQKLAEGIYQVLKEGGAVN